MSRLSLATLSWRTMSSLSRALTRTTLRRGTSKTLMALRKLEMPSCGAFVRDVPSSRGCVLATLGSLLRRHLQLHAFNKDWPLLRIVGQSDDTYVGGPPRLLYPGFAEIQRIDREECDVRTNTDKLKALCPRGGVEGIPDSILEAKVARYTGSSASVLS